MIRIIDVIQESATDFSNEKWGQPSSRAGNSEYYQEDYNLTGYIPVLAEDKGVLVLNQFLVLRLC